MAAAGRRAGLRGRYGAALPALGALRLRCARHRQGAHAPVRRVCRHGLERHGRHGDRHRGGERSRRPLGPAGQGARCRRELPARVRAAPRRGVLGARSRERGAAPAAGPTSRAPRDLGRHRSQACLAPATAGPLHEVHGCRLRISRLHRARLFPVFRSALVLHALRRRLRRHCDRPRFSQHLDGGPRGAGGGAGRLVRLSRLQRPPAVARCRHGILCLVLSAAHPAADLAVGAHALSSGLRAVDARRLRPLPLRGRLRRGRAQASALRGGRSGRRHERLLRPERLLHRRAADLRPRQARPPARALRCCCSASSPSSRSSGCCSR